ncbi:hypothetical protein HDU89_008310 [Geranomyces variabilis]|nr:hypothetical protein HDU89_008310 [Geranomyces variabilis]
MQGQPVPCLSQRPLDVPSPARPPRATAVPQTPQCSGVNRSTGQPCNRRTQGGLCHHHRFDSAPHDKRYAAWVDGDLRPATRHRLYAELQKPISPKDKPGFIYAYQLLARDDAPVYSSMYKIGRTSNIPRRLNEWSTRCGYTPSLVGQFPKTTTPIRHSHRCERLIHIELSERFGAGPIVCPGKCREAHYEWFKDSGDSAGQSDWEDMKTVIEKWVRFAQAEVSAAAPDHVEMDVKEELNVDRNDSEMAEIADMLSDLCLKGRTYATSPGPSKGGLLRRDLSPACTSQADQSVYYSDCSCSVDDSDDETWEDVVPLRTSSRIYPVSPI